MKSNARLGLCLMVMLALAACSSRQSAPVIERAPAAGIPAPKPAAPAAPPPTVAAAGTYIVKRGDTLYGIALDHGHDYRDIAAWNNLANPNQIQIGQVLRVIPPAATVAAPAVRATSSAATTAAAAPAICASSRDATAITGRSAAPPCAPTAASAVSRVAMSPRAPTVGAALATPASPRWPTVRCRSLACAPTAAAATAGGSAPRAAPTTPAPGPTPAA